MKKKFLLLVLLMLSVFSFKGVEAKVADVSIKDIKQIEKTGETEVVSDATFSGMNINYNIMFKEVNDSIKYKITLVNKGSEDIYINNKGEIGGSNYIVYDYIWDDNQNVIKGNTEKTFELKITYKKQVESTTFEKGTYVEAKDLVIKISDQKGNSLPARNPKTDSNLSIFIILLSIEILLVMAVTIYLIKNKKLNIRNLKQMKKANMISAGVFLVLVLGTIIGYSYALEATEIVLNSTVKVSKARLARSCSSDSYAIDHPYDNTESMYQSIGENFPFAAEGKIVETGIDENDYCLDWNIEIEKAEKEFEKRYPTESEMLRLDSDDINIIRNLAEESREILNTGKEEITTFSLKNISNELSSEKMMSIFNDNNSLNSIKEGNVQTLYKDNKMINTFVEENNTNKFTSAKVVDVDQDRINENKISLITLATKDLPEIYKYNNGNYELIYTSDVSDLQNGEVVLGFYISEDNGRPLIIIGEDGGVLAPVDSSWLFGFLDRKMPFSSQQLDILQGIGPILDSIQDPEAEELIGEYFNYKRIIEKPQLQLLLKKNIQIGVMLQFNDFKLDNMEFSDTNNMSAMFAGSGLLNPYSWSLTGLNKWNTSSVKDMSGMFIGVGLINTLVGSPEPKAMSLDFDYVDLGSIANVPRNVTIEGLENLNTSNVEDMALMFTGAFNNVENINIANWDVSNVKDMFGMFAASMNFTRNLDLSKWNVSNVEDMTAMFLFSLNTLPKFDISAWNVSKVKYMMGTFALTLNNLKEFDISKWNVSNVREEALMFAGSLNQIEKFDISKWNQSKAKLMTGMFLGSLNKIDSFDISKWNTSNVEDMTLTFALSLNNAKKVDMSKLNTQKVYSLAGTFLAGLNSVETFDLTDWNTSNVRVLIGTFAASLNENTKLDLSKWDTSNVISSVGTFVYTLNNLEKFDISKWNTSNITNMSGMFAASLNNIEKFDLSKWDTSKVEYMSGTFNYALNSIDKLDISKWNTKNVTTMYDMFEQGLNSVTSFDISAWDVSNVTDMSRMFATAFELLPKLDLSKWNVSKVTDMSSMFYYGLNSVNSFDISKWNVSNVSNMTYMFQGSMPKVTSFDISKWDTSKVKSGNYMFYSAFNKNNITLYTNNFDYKSLTSYSNMFNYMSNNAKIYVKDQTQKDRILGFSKPNRPEAWTDTNIVIA